MLVAIIKYLVDFVNYLGGALENIGFCLAGSFLIALRNSWRLPIEVAAGSQNRT